MLQKGLDVLQKAHEGYYAVGAFNFSNMEFAKAIVEAAEELESPVILSASQGAIKYAGIEQIEAIAKAAADSVKVPVVLHLDHGSDMNVIYSCIRHGFSSVMIDASKHPLDENIRLTRHVADIAHGAGISIEAEIGRIGGAEEHIVVAEGEEIYTDPAEAKKLVDEAMVDYLAIAVGTAHGVYKGEPRVDFERIREIKKLLDMPLVLHGSSGVPEATIKEAIRSGINKINIDTDLRQAFAKSLRVFLAEKPEEYDPRKILTPTREAVKEVVKKKIEMFGSVGKA